MAPADIEAAAEENQETRASGDEGPKPQETKEPVSILTGNSPKGASAADIRLDLGSFNPAGWQIDPALTHVSSYKVHDGVHCEWVSGSQCGNYFLAARFVVECILCGGEGKFFATIPGKRVAKWLACTECKGTGRTNVKLRLKKMNQIDIERVDVVEVEQIPRKMVLGLKAKVVVRCSAFSCCAFVVWGIKAFLKLFVSPAAFHIYQLVLMACLEYCVMSIFPGKTQLDSNATQLDSNATQLDSNAAYFNMAAGPKKSWWNLAALFALCLFIVTLVDAVILICKFRCKRPITDVWCCGKSVWWLVVTAVLVGTMFDSIDCRAFCSAIKNETAFCGNAKVYDDTKENNRCTGTTCSRVTVRDVKSCCKDVLSAKREGQIISTSRVSNSTTSKSPSKNISNSSDSKSIISKAVIDEKTCGVDVPCFVTSEITCAAPPEQPVIVEEEREVEVAIPRCYSIEHSLCAHRDGLRSVHGSLVFITFGSWFSAVVISLASLGSLCFAFYRLFVPEAIIIVPVEDHTPPLQDDEKMNRYTIFLKSGKCLQFHLGCEIKTDVILAMFRKLPFTADSEIAC